MPSAIACAALDVPAGWPRTHTSPVACAVQAEDRARDLRAPGADQPGKAEHLAGAQRERDVAEAHGARQALDTEQLLARLGAHVRRKVFFEPAADHHLDERGPIDLGGGPRRHVPSVAQHRDGVAELEDLFEPVADVDARDAALAQPADDRVEPLGFVLRQAARRLVEDDQARALSDRRRRSGASAAGRS